MARKSSHSEEELPFVALMDTMTNVVGVLIIVLVMVGINLARSVNKVLSDLPPVTVEEHAKLKQEVTETTPKHDPKRVEAELKELEQKLPKITQDLGELETTRDKQPVKLLDLAELEKQLAERRKERDQKKSAIESLLAEVDKLKQRLDTKPIYVPPPAVVVKLPNPRPMPDKAEIHRFLIANNRILYVNDEGFAQQIEAELKRAETTLALSREVVKGADGKPVMVKDKAGRPQPQRKIVYDPKKVADYFARARLGSREMKLEVIPSPTSPRIPLKISPLPNAGETIDQARSLISQFQTVLKKLKMDPHAVVWFHVFRDSIPTYLQARDMADALGLPVGWEITGNAFYIRTLPPDLAVAFTPPPVAPAGTASAVQIAPPKSTVD